jgi:hypothetical protein
MSPMKRQWMNWEKETNPLRDNGWVAKYPS